jgi:hypothetical protein
VIRTWRHDLIDRGANALAHILHVFEKCLVGIKRSLLDGRASHVIGNARWPQCFALRLYRGLVEGTTIPMRFRNPKLSGTVLPSLQRASHATPSYLK